MDSQSYKEALIQQVGGYFQSTEPSELLTPISGLLLLRHTQPTTTEATFYDPAFCLILQGEKETSIGERTLRFGSGESLIVSHELPVSSRIIEASYETPYLAMITPLDLTLLRGLYEQVAEAGLELEKEQVQSMQVHETDTELLGTLARYLALAERPLEAPVLAPLILKELHFRLLIASHGSMLRQLLKRDSHASKISRAIGQIRKDFRISLSIPDLAKTVGMSSSSFHTHFKSITMTTPLQYQKSLRLLEARRLLSAGGHTVSTAAFEVGYESPTQFSREYTRKFGASPRNDLNRTKGKRGH